jgi:hypothetical protein
VKPDFSDTLDDLVDVTKDHIHNSLQLLWAVTQQQSVLPKINASIESVQVPSVCGAASDRADICIVLVNKVRFKVYFWLCIHKVQEYWRGLSTSLTLGGQSLDKWFKVIHEDIVTYVYCFLTISQSHTYHCRIWGIHDPRNVCICGWQFTT